ncbi:MAG: hypothetical protein ACP5E4_03170 [Candidatus Aenigmatarchaeota archaeon]
MDYKKAAKVLVTLSKSQSLTDEEKEALSVAIGLLSWAALSKSHISARKAKKERKCNAPTSRKRGE